MSRHDPRPGDLGPGPSPTDPRDRPLADRPLAHRLRWGWGDNTPRDLRVLIAIALLLTVGAALVMSQLRPLLTEDGIAYVRGVADVAELSDDELQDLARAVCDVRDSSLSLDAVAGVATADLGRTVSRRAAGAVREVACPA